MDPPTVLARCLKVEFIIKCVNVDLFIFCPAKHKTNIILKKLMKENLHLNPPHTLSLRDMEPSVRSFFGTRNSPMSNVGNSQNLNACILQLQLFKI